MSLMQMGEKMETVKFLDDFDMTLSLDSRSSASHQKMNIELSAKPIIIRASYRDINLITSIMNKAFEHLGPSGSKDDQTTQSQKATILTKSGVQPIGQARALMTMQQVSSNNHFKWSNLLMTVSLRDLSMASVWS
jgi:vacuolar protein sorting-associated protein 13A/C